ncbi:hypothetical protein GCM10027578_22350 [Spirosoma luteolum]
MLHPSLSRNALVVNGIYPNQFGTGNDQLDPTSFRTNQGDVVVVSHSESFALRAYLKGATALALGVSINTVPAVAADVIERSGTALTLADGVLSFDGSADADITIGAVGKPLVGPALFTVSNFLPLIGTNHSLVLSLGKTKGLYLITLQASTIAVYTWANNAWGVASTITNPQPFTASDIVSFRIGLDKITVEVGNTAQWSKNRSWSIALSSPDLGKVATAVDGVTIDPAAIPFGTAVPITIGTKAGNYAINVANQDGATFGVAQAIEVTADAAVSAPVTDESTLQTLLLASMLKNNVAATGITPPAAAETPDWRKIMTWGGIGLAGLLVVIGLAVALRK